jgi:hypothetical protein
MLRKPGTGPGTPGGPPVAGGPGAPMNAGDMSGCGNGANNRTLLAYIRTAISFAGLGLRPGQVRAEPEDGACLRIPRDRHGPYRAAAHRHRFRVASCRTARGRSATTRYTLAVAISHVAGPAIGCTLVCALLTAYIATDAV